MLCQRADLHSSYVDERAMEARARAWVGLMSHIAAWLGLEFAYRTTLLCDMIGSGVVRGCLITTMTMQACHIRLLSSVEWQPRHEGAGRLASLGCFLGVR